MSDLALRVRDMYREQGGAFSGPDPRVSEGLSGRVRSSSTPTALADSFRGTASAAAIASKAAHSTSGASEKGPEGPQVHLCSDRVSVGLEPACAQACPTQAIAFGTKADMLGLARTHIADLNERGYD
jgi:hypothetical protein